MKLEALKLWERLKLLLQGSWKTLESRYPKHPGLPREETSVLSLKHLTSGFSCLTGFIAKDPPALALHTKEQYSKACHGGYEHWGQNFGTPLCSRVSKDSKYQIGKQSSREGEIKEQPHAFDNSSGATPECCGFGCDFGCVYRVSLLRNQQLDSNSIKFQLFFIGAIYLTLKLVRASICNQLRTCEKHHSHIKINVWAYKHKDKQNHS